MRRWASVVSLLGFLLASHVARALPRPPIPVAPAGADLREALGAAVPADLPFRDATGRPVRLGDFLGAGPPIVLTLAYYRCPMLCDLVLHNLADTLKRVGWIPGRDYRALTVSIDPKDTPGKARLKQTSVLQAIGQPRATADWPFLVGGESAQRLATVVGFGYSYDAKSDQFAHPAVAMVLTPDGRVSRYLYGVAFRPLDVRLALTEAGAGRIGRVVDRILLTCFRYDPSTRRYGFVVTGVLKGGSALVLLLASVGLGLLVRHDRARQREEEPSSDPEAPPCR